MITNDKKNQTTINNSIQILKSLSKSSDIQVLDKISEEPENYLSSVVKGIEIIIILNIEIDKEAELERLGSEAKRLEGQIFGIQKKLENEKFVSNAPEEVVAIERKKLADMSDNLAKIRESISKL